MNTVSTPHSGDQTVHLMLDLEEDLEEHLEDFSRLSRLGHFNLAKDYFKEHLQHHIGSPYILLQYAELLLQQGDYRGVTLLDPTAIFRRDVDISSLTATDSMLRSGWELVQILAKYHTLDTCTNPKIVLKEAFKALRKVRSFSGQCSSTEIRLIGLISKLKRRDRSYHLRYPSWYTRGWTSIKKLYLRLLDQGRVWDVHDFIVLMPSIDAMKSLAFDVFGLDLIPSLQKMISDWTSSVTGYDTSTSLALLSTMTHIISEPLQAEEEDCRDILALCVPLAKTIMEYDPENLKSRPYLRYLLAHSRYQKRRQAINSLETRLKSSPGIWCRPDVALLPIYIPEADEIVDWVPEQPLEHRNSVRLVRRGARDLGDLQTEAHALRELIELSSNPQDDFDSLQHMQLSDQRDVRAYGLTLASNYLVAATKAHREELADKISRCISREAPNAYWGISREFVMNLLLFKTEGRSPLQIQEIVTQKYPITEVFDPALLREVSRKMPLLKDWVDEQRGSGGEKSSKLQRQRNLRAPSTYQDEPQVLDRAPGLNSKATLRERKQDGSSKASPRGKAKDNTPYTPSYPRVKFPSPIDSTSSKQQNLRNERDAQAQLEGKLRKEIEAEFRLRLENARESEHQRERLEEENSMVTLAGLREVAEVMRRQVEEQTEKKARAEDAYRAEQLRREKSTAVMIWQREFEMRRADAREQVDARLTAAQAAILEGEKERRKDESKRQMIRDQIDQLRREKEVLANEVLEQKRRGVKTLADFLKDRARRKEEEIAEATRLKREAEMHTEKRAEAERLAEEKRKVEEKRQTENTQAQSEDLGASEKDQDLKKWIYFQDISGMFKYAVPFDKGRTWQNFAERIHEAFSHNEDIGPMILADHFDVFAPGDMIILPSLWEDLVQPGWTVTIKPWPAKTITDPGFRSESVPTHPRGRSESMQSHRLTLASEDEELEIEEYRSEPRSEDGSVSSPRRAKKPIGKKLVNLFSYVGTTFSRRRRRRVASLHSSSRSWSSEAI